MAVVLSIFLAFCSIFPSNETIHDPCFFHRDDVIPEDQRLLAQLYREASYWKLTSLKKVIEQQKLNLRRGDYETIAMTETAELVVPLNSMDAKEGKWGKEMANW